jgi:hypothetical protein
MRNEFIVAGKAILYTVIGYFLASAIERKLMKKNIVPPLEVPIQE